jgi:hypothetical protein
MTKTRFETALAKGQIGEKLVMKYYKDLPETKSIQTVEEYFGKGYRNKGLRLPDFLVENQDGKQKFIEVKFKDSWPKDSPDGKLTVDVQQVKDYVAVAEHYSIPVELFFVCINEGRVYRLTSTDLQEEWVGKHYNKQCKNYFYTYSTMDLEILLHDLNFGALPDLKYSESLKILESFASAG